MKRKMWRKMAAFFIIVILLVQYVPVHGADASIDPSSLLGVWVGTYTGFLPSEGGQTERTLRLDIDYACYGIIEGVATIGGESNGSYLFTGTIDVYTGDIVFQGTDWIEDPGQMSFAQFFGVYSQAQNCITGTVNQDPDRSFAIEKVSNEYITTRVDFSSIVGVWSGTYLGSLPNGGGQVIRELELIIDYSSNGVIEGIASIDGGTNGRYYFDGTLLRDGQIHFRGSDWLADPGNMSFSDFSGYYNDSTNTISGILNNTPGKAFALAKVSDEYTPTRLDLTSIPKEWAGEYDGYDDHGTHVVVRRDLEIHIQTIDNDGAIRGIAIVSPSEKSDAVYSANGSYYFRGTIDQRRGKISMQGYEWIQYPVSYDNFGYVLLQGTISISPNAEIHGTTADGIWNMAAINYDSIRTISGFTLGRNNNNYVHTNSETWDGAGFVGSTDYTIDEAYFHLLTQNSSKGEKNRIKKDMLDEWGGSCYGIAMSMGLLYEGYINICDLTNTSGKTDYYSLDYPCTDSKFLNMINYYQLSQGLEHGGKSEAAVSVAYNNGVFSGLVNWVYGYDSLPVFLRKMVNYCASDHVELLGYSTSDGGHAVLITGCEFDTDSDQYLVEIYDENCISSPDSLGRFSYMTVAKDYTSFSFTDANGETLSNDTYTSIYFLDWNALGSVVTGTSSNYTGHTRISFPMGRQFKIVTADGEYLEYTGAQLSGNVAIYGLDTMDSDEASRIVIEIADTDTLTLTEIADGVDMEVYNDTDFMALSGTDIETAVMDLGQSITLSGDEYHFDAYITTGEVAKNENGLISLSATTTSDVTITTEGTGVSVESDEEITDVSAGSYIGTDALIMDYSNTGTSFTIDEDAMIEGATEVNPNEMEFTIRNASYDEATGKVSVRVISKSSASVLVAAYDQNGRVLTVKQETIEGLDRSQNISIVLNNIPNAHSIKVFVLDSATCQPLCESKPADM